MIPPAPSSGEPCEASGPGVLAIAVAAIVFAFLLGALTGSILGQSTLIEFPSDPDIELSIDPAAPAGSVVVKDQGFLRISIHRFQVPGKLYGIEIENRGRVVWDGGGDWVPFTRWVVKAPAPLAPTWHPWDGTKLESPGEWTVIGPDHAVHRHGWGGAHQPPGHGLEGRQILRVLVGEPGVECPVSPAGMKAVRDYVGGGLGGGGVPGLNAVCQQWGLGANPFDVAARPRQAGTWWLSAHDLYPWSWIPFRGVQRLGATPGADGRRGGENGRYSSATWMLASGSPGSELLALHVARSIASCGVVHEGAPEAPGYSKAWATGMRRIEASTGDFIGDATQPAKSHNWTDDVQLAASVFPADPLLERAAREMRSKLLREPDLFKRVYQTRDVDRWLSGLRAAYFTTGDPDGRYRQHARRVIDSLFATMRPGEAWFPDTVSATRWYVSPWMDAGTLWRVIEWSELAPDSVSPAILTRVEAIIRFYMSLNTKVSTDVVTRYRMLWDGAAWVVDPQDAPWLQSSYYPSLVKWWVGPLFWLGSRDPSFRPTARAVLLTWTARHQNPSEEWVEGNVSAKTRGQAMLGCLRGGAMIRAILSW